MAQAVELIETVEKTGLVYAYAENYCYMDVTFDMWRQYKEGAIGDVTYAECEYIHDCSGAWIGLTYGDTGALAQPPLPYLLLHALPRSYHYDNGLSSGAGSWL